MDDKKNTDTTGIMRDSQLDQAEGGLKEAEGKVELSAGDLTGDTDLKARGAAKETEGKAENMWGKAKEKVADTVNQVGDAFNPNSGDSTTNRDYR